MNYNDENEMWDWQGQDCGLEDSTSIDIYKCFANEDHLSCMLGDATTPVKFCGDLAYHVTSDDAIEKELDQSREPSSQVKRRRMLHFEPDVMGSPLFSDNMFLRSKETQDSFKDAISEMSQWVAGFSEDTSASSNDYLNPSADNWIADCFNDAEMHLGTENISTPGASDIQIDITGSKSYIRTPSKLPSSVVYPFTFIKPCGVLGDMTLKDINRKIHTPPNSKQNEQDPCGGYPTSAFSGKPVVGKTKIRTEGGEGSITIVRTKG